jgi:hypothetical protein
MRRVTARALVLAVLAACSSRPKAEHVAIDQADALWGGDAFCARTALGLACWESSQHSAVDVGPTIVAGLKNVTQVVLASGGQGCALHDGDVTCFRPGKAESRARTFDQPTQLVATRGYQSSICVLHASGVSCWKSTEQPELRQDMGRPSRLLAGRTAICGVYPDGTRCFPQDPQGGRAGVFLPGVVDPRGVLLDSKRGEAWVLDGTKLLHAHFQGTLQDVFASAELRPVPDVGPVRALASRSVWGLALDDRGVVQLDYHGGFDLKRWPIDGVSSAVFDGAYEDFFTVEGGVLSQRGWREGQRIDRPVSGTTDVIDVHANLYFTCALERGGGVACLESSRM